ncbi:MAG TPA: nucleotide exchange factor GrpE [Candidatus Saccharimonadales bacterium]|jgi:molecular chaperone GrpE|nr:nucleotide exchange factor GrpE [Candidatus Saccharimonadales bacterium]
MSKQPASEPPKQPKHTKQDDTNMSLLQQQIDELTAAVQRERADAVNMRRQHEAQVASLKTAIKGNVVRDLLPVIDNFERALKHVPADLANHDYIKGVQGIVKQFEKTLADLGVEKIKTVGEPFDPKWHEAVMMEEGDGTQEIVCEELQPGYRIGDEVIRHAMVKVKMQ